MDPDSFSCHLLRHGDISGFVERARVMGPRFVRPFLPSLVRMALCSSVDTTTSWSRCQKEILSILSGIEMVNSIVRCLQVDFSQLKDDLLKHGQMQRKLADSSISGPYAASKSLTLTLKFENAETDSENCGEEKLRLVLNEVTRAAAELSGSSFSVYKCELFENDMFVSEVSDIICVALSELPSLLPLKSVVLALLRVERGSWLICRLAANLCHKVDQIASILLSMTELQDESLSASQVRSTTLSQLCSLFPPSWLSVRQDAINLLKLPGLVLTLTLNHSSFANGVVTLLTSLLCSADKPVREWMSQYIKLSCRRMKNVKQIETCFVHLQKHLDSQIMSLLDTTAVQSLNREQSVDITEAGSGPSGRATPLTSISVAVVAEEEETMELEYGTTNDTLQQPGISLDSETERQDRVSLGDATTVLLDSQTKVAVMEMKTDVSQEGGMTSFLVDGVEDRVDSLVESTCISLSDDAVEKANMLLHLYCMLLGSGVYTVRSVSSQLIVELMTQHPPISSAGVRYIELSICLLMAYPHLISDTTRSQRFTDWLIWLLVNRANFECLKVGEGCFTEMLLLVAVHFHSSCYEAIAELVSDILGVQGCVRPGSLAALRIMFVQDVFTEEVLVDHGAKVPITQQLSGHMSGLLPINCIHELFKTHLFEKHGVSIQDWLYQQILHSTYPLHPLLPVIVQEFVSSLFLPNRIELRSLQDIGFSETMIMDVFSSRRRVGEQADRVTPQLLMLFYVLSFQQTMRANMKHTGLLAVRHMHSRMLSVCLSIPVKQLVTFADRHHDWYGELSPYLVRLLSTLLPELCLVKDWLEEEDGSLSISHVVKISRDIKTFTLGWSKHGRNKDKIPQFRLKNALCQLNAADPDTFVCLLYLERQPSEQLVPYMRDLMTSLKIALDQEIPRQIQVLVRSIWFRLNTIVPRRLWLQTVNVLQQGSTVASPNPDYTHEALSIDPLSVLRCDVRVFRCPPIFEIVLHILKAYLVASKSHLSTHAFLHPIEFSVSGGHQQEGRDALTEQERDELRLAIENTQDSVAAQLLLEICLPSEQEQQISHSGRQLSDLQEVRCHVCSFLHQTFISNPTLVKLLHFQGYNLELIPVLVSNVPSMHICRDFLPELLKQPQLKKQLFAIHLASHLAVRYPLVETMEVGHQCLTHLVSLLTSQPREICKEVMLSVLPTICRFCSAFPVLCEEAAALLLQLLRAALSWASVSSAVSNVYGKQLPISNVSAIALTRMVTREKGSVGHLIGDRQDNSLFCSLQSVVAELLEIMGQW